MKRFITFIALIVSSNAFAGSALDPVWYDTQPNLSTRGALAVGPTGIVYYAQQKEVFTWALTNPQWERMGWKSSQVKPLRTETRELAIGPKNEIWAVINGMVSMYDGNSWTSIPHPLPATETPPGELQSGRRNSIHGLSVAPDGAIFALSQKQIFRWNGKTWDKLNGPETESMSIGPRGEVWVIGSSGVVSVFDGKTWKQLPPAAPPATRTSPDISVGRGKGEVFIIHPEGTVFRWDVTRWSIFGGYANGSFDGKGKDDTTPSTPTRIAVDLKGNPWVLDSRYAVRAFGDARHTAAGVALVTNTTVVCPPTIKASVDLDRSKNTFRDGWKLERETVENANFEFAAATKSTCEYKIKDAGYRAFIYQSKSLSTNCSGKNFKFDPASQSWRCEAADPAACALVCP